jgi:hypothetical protein
MCNLFRETLLQQKWHHIAPESTTMASNKSPLNINTKIRRRTDRQVKIEKKRFLQEPDENPVRFFFEKKFEKN